MSCSAGNTWSGSASGSCLGIYSGIFVVLDRCLDVTIVFTRYLFLASCTSHINVRCCVFSCLIFCVSSESIVICFTIFIHKMLD